MLTNCDMCGTKIENNRCSCGQWTTKEERGADPMFEALLHFHKMKSLNTLNLVTPPLFLT